MDKEKIESCPNCGIHLTDKTVIPIVKDEEIIYWRCRRCGQQFKVKEEEENGKKKGKS